jgi:hypothetical protein
MRNIILAAVAAVGLSGCTSLGGGYGSGVSVGIGSGYGGYGGYGGYNGYGGSGCIAYDRFGRAYYTCGYGSYYGANRYSYSPGTAVYYYPGYTYRNGYYYDRFGLRVDRRTLYNRYYNRYPY